jgi:7-cyano-7-deazaguanine synthase
MTESILLSGGVDSAAIAYWRSAKHAITIDYGQNSAASEIKASSIIAKHLGIVHDILHIDCRSLGAGEMVGKDACPVGKVPEWWPFRNQLLITLAGARLVGLGIQTLVMGTVRTDSVHGDGTAEFYLHMDRLLGCQEGGLRVIAPALDLSSEELAITSKVPRSILGWTHSCNRSSTPCGECRSCSKRAHLFDRIGLAP